MERASDVIVLAGLIAAALLVGIALCFPFFSVLPFYWGVGLAGLFLLSYVASVKLKRRVVLGVYAASGFAYSTLFLLTVLTCTGVERLEEYECGWRMQSGQVEIDLRSVGGFGWSPVSSEAMLEHLKKDQPATVHVEVRVTRDFGRVRTRGAIKRVDGIPVREF